MPLPVTFIIEEMAERMEEHLPDVIVIAGDVAESLQTPNHFGTALHIFRKTYPFADLLVVPGNHDLWVNSGKRG